LVNGQELTMCDIVWVSPQSHSSLSVKPHFLWHALQWPWPGLFCGNHQQKLSAHNDSALNVWAVLGWRTRTQECGWHAVCCDTVTEWWNVHGK